MSEQWQVVYLNNLVEDEFHGLPKDIKAKFSHVITMIEDLGLPTLTEPYVKHIEGRIWEIRVKSKSGHGRGLYCTTVGRRVVILRCFIKKSAKTPQGELRLAKRRLTELQ